MRILTVLIGVIVVCTLTGCELLGCHRCRSDARASSSLVEFLYPNNRMPPAENSIPSLQLPLRVGLAFLPQRPGAGTEGLEAARRDELLERIRKRFQSRKFVGEIVVVPDYYLSANQGPSGVRVFGSRGFDGLAAVQRLYNFDVIALVSYDQVSYRDANSWSLGYITIVGAYVLKGTRHEVTTLMDLAVVDPASRSLILRAGGTDERHGTTTRVSERRETRETRTESFDRATDQLIDHFDSALTQFEADVREGKANVNVTDQQGRRVSGGGGSFDWLWLAVLAFVLACRGHFLFRTKATRLTRPGAAIERASLRFPSSSPQENCIGRFGRHAGGSDGARRG